MNPIKLNIKKNPFKKFGIGLTIITVVLFVGFTAWAYTNTEKVDENSPFLNTFSSPVSQATDVPFFQERYFGNKKAKLSVEKQGGRTQHYLLPSDNINHNFAFTQGNGTYTVTLYESFGPRENNNYTLSKSRSYDIELQDPFGPFLISNFIVNFQNNSSLSNLSDDLYSKSVNSQEYIYHVYDYVSDKLAYNQEKADALPHYYISDISRVLEEGSGICTDYATAMVALLRLQGIPSRITTGEALDGERHAWVEVYYDTDGFLYGSNAKRPTNWHLFDPTRMALEKQNGKDGFTMKDLSEFKIQSFD